MDDFDRLAAEFEAELSTAIAQAYRDAEAAIDIGGLTAAIEAGDENALIDALNIDEGIQSNLEVSLNGGLFFVVLGSIVIAMKRFASRHRSRVSPEGLTQHLRDEIRRNIIEPLARRAYESALQTAKAMTATGFDSKLTASATVKAISLSPDQARSIVLLHRAVRDALNHPKPVVLGNMLALTATETGLIRRRYEHGLNAAQQAMIRKALSTGYDEASLDKLIRRHTQALINYRQEVFVRQEAIRAINTGEYLAFRQGKANRSIPRAARRFWVTKGDERVRHNHAAVETMNPNGVDVGESFKTPLGPVLFPPLEINCRCRVEVRTP